MVTPGQKQTLKKSSGKSLFHRLNNWLHLWLGISSGLVIVIVSVTGCLIVFEREIKHFTEPFQYVKEEDRPFLRPSALKEIAEQDIFADSAGVGINHIYSITYHKKGFAATASYVTQGPGYREIFINPYSGEVLKFRNHYGDFFDFMLTGHSFLWLPPRVGKPIVAWSILFFTVLLISGMIKWWPKNLKKSNGGQSFKIKWKATFKRLNYDLHSVLGFYVMLIALMLALTGLVWGFKWFSKTYYYTITGGKSLINYAEPLSDTTMISLANDNSVVDRLWLRLQNEYRETDLLFNISFPQERDEPIRVYINPDETTYYKYFMRYFDRYTLKELPTEDLYLKKFSVLSPGEKIFRVNHDLHVGAIGGLPGKMLIFSASLICGSLPITGFIIWRGKKKRFLKMGHKSFKRK